MGVTDQILILMVLLQTAYNNNTYQHKSALNHCWKKLSSLNLCAAMARTKYNVLIIQNITLF